LAASQQAQADNYRTIASVAPVEVEAPQGTAPRLPATLWVTYNDGTQEYRQIRWTNAALATEQKEAANAESPYTVGEDYTVRGYIIGDNTTANGYPVQAHVKVVNGSWQVPSHTPVANPLPLDKVKINGNNRLTSNRELDINEILSWDVSQQLYNYRVTYNLPTDGYKEADGWDSPTTKLKGHGTGHYLSALAFAFSCCEDPVKKSALRENIRRMVNEMRACQERTFVYDESLGRYREARDYAPEDELRNLKGSWEAFAEYEKDYAHYGYGYMNAIPAAHCVLIEKYSPYNNESGVWAPYYTVHKQLAGLIDIATYIDDKEIAQKALRIATDMGLWVWNRMHYRTFVKSDGTQEERRAKFGNRYEMWNMYIAGEVGGISESLSRLSEMATDKQEKERLIEAAGYFNSPALMDPLARNVDAIRTRHANQHIPMIVGAIRSYRSNNDPYYYNMALNFWNFMQGRYRYAMGGVGNIEMFRQPYSQIMSMCTNVTSDGSRNLFPMPEINETCCAYNLAKLSKELNCFDPDDARYMDYYERLLSNQIVGSVDPHHYGVTYQYAVGLNASKPFGNENPQSTCCGGTGSENHVKYQEAAYFASDNTLWVALYMPTTATWDAQGVTLEQECSWPAEKSTIRIKKGSGKFTLKLRVPYWATRGFDVKLNGKSVATEYRPCSYMEIPCRKWSKKDVVEVTMPFDKHIDFGPDKMQIAATGMNETKTEFTPQWAGAIMYGPLVMSTNNLQSWDEATMDVASDLSNIKLCGSDDKEGTDGNIYTLTLQGHTFYPDYYNNRNVTHYLRLNVESDPNAVLSDDVKELLSSEGLNKSELNDVVQVARSRRDAQKDWNDMAVKVPEYAPWAPNGFNRMMTEYDKAIQLLMASDADCTQEDVDKAAASLNACINSMRPGNLPELEDLNELLPLLKQAKEPKSAHSYKKQIDYAEMVVRYVSDGSGTMDMITKATNELKKVLK
jgi:DUF1680 family protein